LRKSRQYSWIGIASAPRICRSNIEASLPLHVAHEERKERSQYQEASRQERTTREPDAHRRLTSQLLTWLEERKLAPAVGKVFEFEDFRDAFKTMQNRSALGKMVVRIR
jgi:NADPH:quinone reductase-like Zn-dependent oxidoreductase